VTERRRLEYDDYAAFYDRVYNAVKETPLLDALDLKGQRCGLCEEPFTEPDCRNGNVAEMYDPDKEDEDSRMVHAECGISQGWLVA
jgi:hypothetical protein